MMTEYHDDSEAREAIREAFPADAGLSAEKTRELYAELRAAEGLAPRGTWTRWVAAASAAVVIVGGLAIAAVYAARPAAVPPPSAPAVAERPRVRQETGPQLIPALALKAIGPSAEGVLHFTSVADTEFGPDAGHSTEEMWFEPASGRGRLVRKDMRGDRLVVTKTIISDGKTAEVVTQRPGEEAVARPAAARDLRSLDKLSAYRKMLESGTATVTARATRDGVQVYKVRAVVPGFGGSELEMVMEAEVRASDYLPLSYSAGFQSADGKKSLQLSRRSFSSFERLKAEQLPADWFKPNTTGEVRDEGAPAETIKI